MPSIDFDRMTTDIARLDPKATLRLREDGTGLATTTWERFKVAFLDLFRSSKTKAGKQKETITAFQEAARKHYGAELAELVMPAQETEKLGHLTFGQVKSKLKAFKDCADPWIRAELEIQRAAKLQESDDNRHVTQTTLLKQGLDQVLQGIPQTVGNRFRQQYDSTSTGLDNPALSELSEYIVGRLHETVTERFNERHPYQVDKQYIEKVGTDAVAEFMNMKHGGALRQAYLDNHPELNKWLVTLAPIRAPARDALIDSCRRSKPMTSEQWQALVQTSRHFESLATAFKQANGAAVDERATALVTVGEQIASSLPKLDVNDSVDGAMSMVSMAWTIYLGRHSEDDIRCFRDYLSLPKVSESESTSESVTNRIADRLNIEMEKPVSDEALLKTHVNYARAMMVNEAIQQCASLLPA